MKKKKFIKKLFIVFAVRIKKKFHASHIFKNIVFDMIVELWSAMQSALWNLDEKWCESTEDSHFLRKFHHSWPEAIFYSLKSFTRLFYVRRQWLINWGCIDYCQVCFAWFLKLFERPILQFINLNYLKSSTCVLRIKESHIHLGWQEVEFLGGISF